MRDEQLGITASGVRTRDIVAFSDPNRKIIV